MYKRAIQLLSIVIVMASGAVLGVALSSATLYINAEKLQLTIAQAFENGGLVNQSYLGKDSRRGRYSFNDCLILQSLIVGRDSWEKVAVQSTILQVPNETPCTTLNSLVNGQIDQIEKQKQEYPYARYFFAAKAFAGFGLAAVSLDTLRLALRGTIYLMLAISLIASLHGVLRGGKHPPILYITVATIASAWLGLYDLWYYSPTLAHAFSEIALVGFITYSVLMDPPATQRAMYGRCVVLFMLTAWFELLTGPTLLAIALGVMIDFAHHPSDSGSHRKAAKMWVFGLFSVASCLICLQFINWIVTGSNPFRAFFTHLSIRADLHHLLGIPIDERWRVSANLTQYSLTESWMAIWENLHMLTYGSTLGANLIFGSSMVVLCLAALIGSLSAKHRHLLVYASTMFALAIWYAALTNHTVIHAWAIVRMMVLLPIAAALACVVFSGYVPLVGVVFQRPTSFKSTGIPGRRQKNKTALCGPPMLGKSSKKLFSAPHRPFGTTS